ncbi:hypothetical protein E4T56_gene8171 [Termitomyces sp. T112]|nr:hypothetical protein E4T56_gene8171 [Termitomyces sp. T112]
MPPSTSFHKPPTAPCAAIAAMPSSHHEPPDYIALCNGIVKWNSAGVIIAILHYPPFTSAIVGTWSTAQALPSSADWACYFGLLDLISFLFFSLHLSYVFGQAFSNQANFACIADQSGLPGLLSNILKLPSSAWDILASAKAFSSFANGIIAIDDNCQKLCYKHEAEAIDPNGKPKPKKVKASPSAASYKPGSNAALALLGQVDAMLEAVLLVDDMTLVPCANLKKHHATVELAAQQQLFFLDIALQTSKLIEDCLDHLNKALGPSEVDCTSTLLSELNVTAKSLADNSDMKLLNPSETSPKIPVTLSTTPLV